VQEEKEEVANAKWRQKISSYWEYEI
jgi:hypothetical protein